MILWLLSMDPNNQPRDKKGRYLRKDKSKKEVIRVTSEEKEELELLRELKREQERMQKIQVRLTPYVLGRAGHKFNTLILETVRGEYHMGLEELERFIARLKDILKLLISRR